MCKILPIHFPVFFSLKLFKKKRQLTFLSYLSLPRISCVLLSIYAQIKVEMWWEKHGFVKLSHLSNWGSKKIRRKNVKKTIAFKVYPFLVRLNQILAFNWAYIIDNMSYIRSICCQKISGICMICSFKIKFNSVSVNFIPAFSHFSNSVFSTSLYCLVLRHFCP